MSTLPEIEPQSLVNSSAAQQNVAKFDDHVINYVSGRTQSELAKRKFSIRSLLSRFSKTQNCDQSVQPNKTQQAQIDLIIHNIKNFKTENEAEPAKTGGSAESQHPLYTTNHFLRLAFGNSGQKEQSITPEQALGIIDGALRSDIKPETKTALLELLNGVLSNSEFSDETEQQITDYVNHMISDKENGWPEDVYLQNVGIFYKDGSSFVKDIDSKFNHETFDSTGDNTTLSLLQVIINSSEEVPEWALNLLVGAANSAKNEVTEAVETTDTKIPAWLSEVMRGIKPEAFQKIAEAIISNTSNDILNQENARLATITTLALAALPENDNQINENCMPFTALSGLLSIKNEQDDNLNGPNIVAHIGQALIDADCNYKVGEEARWTNSRTMAFLKALNAIDSTEIQAGQTQSPSDLAKDSLCTCRQGLKGNAYKFDVAIQHIADEACQKMQNKEQQSHNPIIAFLADYLVNASKNPIDQQYAAIGKSMQDFKTDTGETLFQFEPATCGAIKNAMMMSYARTQYEQTISMGTTPPDDSAVLIKKTEAENRNTYISTLQKNCPTFDKLWTDHQRDIEQFFNQTTSNDTKSPEQPATIQCLDLNRSAFNAMVGNFSAIQSRRYDSLSDDKIKALTDKVLEAATSNPEQLTQQLQDGTLFSSNYQLRQVCQSLLKQLPSSDQQQTQQPNALTPEQTQAETALRTILNYYCQHTEFADVEKSLKEGKIKDATDQLIKALCDNAKSIETIQKEIIETQKQQQFKQAKAFFDQHRELQPTPGTNNNCLFYAINKQKPSEEEEKDKYNVGALRERYVEIQKAGKEISKQDEQRLKTEQADISCLPQMATYLERPIVVLTEQTVGSDTGTGIQLFLPKGHLEAEIQLPPINVNMLSQNTTIETWIGKSDDHDAKFNALTEALKVATNNESLSVENVKNMAVKAVLDALLGNDNTIALHFKGNTKSGHYQSFIPEEKKERKTQPVEEVKEEENDNFDDPVDLF